MFGIGFDFKSFSNFQNSLNGYATNEENTLPQGIQKAHEARDVPFGYNEDAQLINSVLWKVDNFDFWKKPAFSPKPCTLFSKKTYEETDGTNPVNTRSCEIIYAFSDKPIAEATKECRQVHQDLISDSPLTKLDAKFDAFLEETMTLEFLKGDVHPKTGETMYPVPVGYIVRDTTSRYREEHSACQTSCQPSYVMYKSEVLETYHILDFVLDGLKKSVGDDEVRRLSKADQRLFVIQTGKPEIQ